MMHNLRDSNFHNEDYFVPLETLKNYLEWMLSNQYDQIGRFIGL